MRKNKKTSAVIEAMQTALTDWKHQVNAYGDEASVTHSDCDRLQKTITRADKYWQFGAVESEREMMQWLYLFNSMDTYPRELMLAHCVKHTGVALPRQCDIDMQTLRTWVWCGICDHSARRQPITG